MCMYIVYIITNIHVAFYVLIKKHHNSGHNTLEVITYAPWYKLYIHVLTVYMHTKFTQAKTAS